MVPPGRVKQAIVMALWDVLELYVIYDSSLWEYLLTII